MATGIGLMSYMSLNDSESPKSSDQQSAGLKPRAQRFPIVTPLLYRESGRPDWNEGTTINISSSGILFSCTSTLQPSTMLEMQIIFPSEITGGIPASVTCVGPVIRTVPQSSPDSLPAQATAILHYRFAHA